MRPFVRPFERRDVPALHALMLQLADFEGYADDFRVTEDDLIADGLGCHPTFGAFVAGYGRELVGYAVHYTIPFTYRMRPTLVLKELYLCDGARGGGIGSLLFGAVVAEARRMEAACLDWLVLPTNVRAKDFYRHQGGQPDAGWERWQLLLD